MRFPDDRHISNRSQMHQLDWPFARTVSVQPILLPCGTSARYPLKVPQRNIARHTRRRCLSLLPSVLYRFPSSVEAQAVSGLARFSRTTPIARRWRNKAEAVYIANGPSTAISAEPLPPLTDDLPSTYSLFTSFSVFYPSPVPPVRFTPPIFLWPSYPASDKMLTLFPVFFAFGNPLLRDAHNLYCIFNILFIIVSIGS